MSDNQKYQRFGKYLIMDHLVDGGMAKICRARYLGEQANKLVAIKMVQPQYSNDEAFVRMFQDELNITFGMLHPNIMQVYDYGKTNGQLYTAMEYIHGADLKKYLDRLKEKDKVFPVEISCYIISQVCLGLHYAHTFTDKLTGKPFNVVHRDISPHNIMLTYDGAVKVIDFGIAKANTNSEATQAGTIKGKLSYLAPEYLEGMELDARYDEFAVGITLWELLCSEKLFKASNDLAVLKQIQACKIDAPSKKNPLVPKELDAIVLKALSKDRANRYENLDQMNRALIKFLYSQYPDFNASNLKNFADELFKKEIEGDNSKFVAWGNVEVQPYIDEMKREESKTGKISKKDVAVKAQVEERIKIREIEFTEESSQVVGIEIEKKVGDLNETRRLARASLQTPKSAPAKSKVPGTSAKRTEKDRTSSRVISKREMEASEQSSSPSIIIIIIAASLAAFAYIQADLVEGIIGINIRKMISGEEMASRTISSLPSTKKAPTQAVSNHEFNEGEVVLSGVDFEMDVTIDGVKAEYAGAPLKISLDKDVTFVIKKNGFVPYVSTIKLTKDNSSTVINVPALERARTGLLSTSLNYTAGSKLVYEEGGQKVERELPVKDLPVLEGHYQASIVNPILGTEKKVEFSIEENKKHFLE